MKKLAPLVIFTYNRLECTKLMLKAIARNVFAKDTEVYVFSDGPKNEKDEELVVAVRKYLYDFASYEYFKIFHIIESKNNNGLANSIINGVSEIIEKYKRIIVLEDDLITADIFLKFMNDSLDFYENNQEVWSIGGTCFDLPSLVEYPHDVYFCYRGESWGWATWYDRWVRVDWEVQDFQIFMKDAKKKRLFQRGGEDMVEALKQQMKGKTDSWAIRWCYQEFKEGMVTVLPVKSLVKNIGWGQEGTHCDIDIFHTELLKDEFDYMLENVAIDNNLMNDYRKYFKRPYLKRILDFIYSRVKGKL